MQSSRKNNTIQPQSESKNDSSAQQAQKAQRMILNFNKNGLQYLSDQKTYPDAFDYFKKAQKTVTDQLKIQPNNIKINQLAAITYNNLACYYKKTNKPKVALSYLKKALQIEVFKVQNWISTSSTHLNICAIYSFLKKHNDALEHASLAIKMLQKWQAQKSQKQKEQQKKAFSNIKMLSNYNAAIQNQYLKNYQQAQKYFSTTIQLANKNQFKNNLLVKQCNQGIQRMKKQKHHNKQRLLEILAKKKENQQKNNKQFMRKNKKNYHKEGDDWRQLIHKRKYLEYKVDTDHSNAQNSKKHQSVGKLVSIKPILHTQQSSKKSLHVKGLKTDKKEKDEQKSKKQ